jgi:uncharacterized FlaG/YvyC family protein
MSAALNLTASAGYSAAVTSARGAPPPTTPDAVRASDTPTGASLKMQRLLERLDAAASSRLVIEKDEASDDFVYKAVDADTGAVTQSWPRQTVLEIVKDLAEQERAGLVLDARA